MLSYQNVKLEDAHTLHRWWNDGAIMAHAGYPEGLGLSLEAVQATIERAIAADSLFILFDQEVPIGEMSARCITKNAPKEPCTYEIGIKICESTYQNAGRGKFYLDSLIRNLFIQKDAQRIILDTNSQNTRAQALYEKLGFRRTTGAPRPWKDQRGQVQYSIDYALDLETWLFHKPLAITQAEAKAFLGYHHGFHQDFPYSGEAGFWRYLKRVGCIQFDPIDVCGKSPELTVHAHVKDFSKKQLYKNLYEDRSLIDYFDKNLAILPIEDWPLLAPMRERYRRIGKSRTGESDAIDAAETHVLDWIHRHGTAASKDLKLDQKVDWYWGPTKLSRATLERLYFQGELIIHHKKRTIKHYALAKDHIPKALLDAPNPFENLETYHQTFVYRRIRAVGFLWAKQSDAFLGILDFKAADRNRAFEALTEARRLFPIKIEGFEPLVYIATEDFETLKLALKDSDAFTQTVAFIAPLDAMIWDRKLIKALWNFDYKWEIYTPESQRRYGYYVLPIFYRGSFVGRIELKYGNDNRQLLQTDIWYEDDFKARLKISQFKRTFQKALTQAIQQLEKFHSH